MADDSLVAVVPVGFAGVAFAVVAPPQLVNDDDVE
jgi:hypothetical protein